MTAVQPAAMLTTQNLADAFANNTRVLAMQTEGLTHSDSLLQPAPRGNCLNWVLGHIAIYRGYILETLGEEKILDDETTARYDYGSEPVLGEEEGVLSLETLLDAINQGQERIAAALARSTPESLEQVVAGREPSTVAARVFYLYFHETYHVGQTEFLRQLAGTDDKVI
jgi:uncharacterized damage-inducible protein DinB